MVIITDEEQCDTDKINSGILTGPEVRKSARSDI